MKIKIALCQINVVDNKEKNIENATSMILKAVKQNADFIVLPEMFNCPYSNEKFIEYCEEETHSPTLSKIAKLANENNTYVAFAAQKGVSGIFGPDMFLVPRNEVVLNESGFADMTMDTRFIFSDESGCPVINLVREKPMLGTRHTTWYDKLIEETDCVL